MRLASFSVKNYRSITHESRIDLDDYTVLVGRNNEGKTNILKAIDLSLSAVGGPPNIRGFFTRQVGYDWSRDYPVGLQEDQPDGSSEFALEYALTREESEDLQSMLGVGVPLHVRLELMLGRSKSSLMVRLGDSEITKARQLQPVMRYLSEGLTSVYIPAVRTNRTAMGALERTIAQRMRVLERNDKYRNALKTVDRLRKEELGRISSQLVGTLGVFLPNVSNVDIVSRFDYEYSMRPYSMSSNSDYEVYVDDGAKTPIKQKGDGIQSLMALAVLSGSGRGGTPTLLIVEEPESHLHPGAIRELRKVLHGISENQGQVLISTHNPLFVRRERVSSNIIVERGGAIPARSIKCIRDTLGVSLSDNLINAEKVILVEGMADRVFLERALPWRDPKLADLLGTGKIAIKEMGGINNLCYELIHLQGELCDFVVMHDNDSTGREQVNKACSQGYINNRLHQVVAASRPNCQTEIEDFLRPEFYCPILTEKLTLSFDESNAGKRNLGIMSNGKDTWSDRLMRVCESSGISVDGELLKCAKTAVSEALRCYEGNLDEVFTEDVGFVDRLVKLLLPS